MAPFDMSTFGAVGYALVFGAIGFGFGAILEMAGFGDTRKLSAQFYFTDLTVLKVMFTAIVVAAVLLAGASAFGLLDMSRVWVNPTYLWPGILGGLIMGVGFVLGGFCPGTSVVAASTLKVDGMLFLLGALGGVWLFGETVGSFEHFFLSSHMGRFTLDEWLGLPVGVTVLLVVAMALLMFWAGELAESHFGRGEPWADVALRPQGRVKLAGAGLLLAASLVVALRGQPSPEQKFALLGPDVKRPVEDRGIFVDPAEVAALRGDLNVQVVIFDVRDEHDFNLFHIGGSRRIDPGALARTEVAKPLLDQPASAVTFLVGNGEATALSAWKSLKVLGAANLYIVEGGLNRWLERYPVPQCVAERSSGSAGADAPAYRFRYATGATLPAAWPELPASKSFTSPCQTLVARAEGPSREAIAWPTYSYTKKVKLKSKAAVKGGCG